MRNASRSFGQFSAGFPCLICGVDSGEIKTFLALFIGGLALSSVFLILWALGSKRFWFSEDKASLALEAEERKDE